MPTLQKKLHKSSESYRVLTNRQTVAIDHINPPAGLPNTSVWATTQVLPSDQIDTKHDELRELLSRWKIQLPAEGYSCLVKWCDASVEKEIRTREGYIIRTIVAQFAASQKPRTMAWGLVFASGLDAGYGEQNSMVEIARRIGVTKQAISKAANQWCQKLGIPKSTLMNKSKKDTDYGDRNDAQETG